MKTFVIVVETAILAFIAGGCIGMLAERETWEAKQANAEQESKESPEA